MGEGIEALLTSQMLHWIGPSTTTLYIKSITLIQEEEDVFVSSYDSVLYNATAPYQVRLSPVWWAMEVLQHYSN